MRALRRLACLRAPAYVPACVRAYVRVSFEYSLHNAAVKTLHIGIYYYVYMGAYS